RALELGGITETTPDPADGRIERDADGRTIGTLQENARYLVIPLLPRIEEAMLIEALHIGQSALHGFGITNWQEAYAQPAVHDIAYPIAAGGGGLTGGVVAALGWDEARGVEQLDELVERRARTTVPRYAPTSVKFFADGVIENFGAAMLEPYFDAA